MTIKEVIQNHTNEVLSKALTIQNEMNFFYEENKNQKDVIELFKLFESKFENIVYSFDLKYSKTSPEIISKIGYAAIPFLNSLTISIELRDSYKKISKMILDKLPPLDDSLEVSEFSDTDC